MPSTAGIVLAGGASRRMGSDKTRLVFDGKPLLDRAVDAMRAACEPIWVVRGERQGATPDGVLVLRDDALGQGPLGGLATGLSEARRRGAERAVVLSADLPLITGAVVEELLAAHGASGADVVLAAEEGRTHPLVGVYSTALAETARAALDRGERTMMSFLDSQEVKNALVSDALALSNVNTPQEWEALLRLRSHP